MNLNPDALQKAYSLAWESGTIESGRLARAKGLAPRTECTYVHRHLDGSTIYEYLVPGEQQPWYAVKAVKSADGKVTIGGHDCPDHKHHDVTCKHMAAVMLAIRALDIEREAREKAQAPIPVVITPEKRERMLAALYPEE